MHHPLILEVLAWIYFELDFMDWIFVTTVSNWWLVFLVCQYTIIQVEFSSLGNFWPYLFQERECSLSSLASWQPHRMLAQRHWFSIKNFSSLINLSIQSNQNLLARRVLPCRWCWKHVGILDHKFYVEYSHMPAEYYNLNCSTQKAVMFRKSNNTF